MAKNNGFNLEEWQSAGITEYDRYEEYMEHVAPLVDALVEECSRRGFTISGYICHTQRSDGDHAGHMFTQLPDDIAAIPAESLIQATVRECSKEGVIRLLALVKADQERLAAARGVSIGDGQDAGAATIH